MQYFPRSWLHAHTHTHTHTQISSSRASVIVTQVVHWPQVVAAIIVLALHWHGNSAAEYFCVQKNLSYGNLLLSVYDQTQVPAT